MKACRCANCLKSPLLEREVLLLFSGPTLVGRRYITYRSTLSWCVWPLYTNDTTSIHFRKNAIGWDRRGAALRLRGSRCMSQFIRGEDDVQFGLFFAQLKPWITHRCGFFRVLEMRGSWTPMNQHQGGAMQCRCTCTRRLELQANLLYHYPKYAIVIGPTRVTWYVQIITVDRCSGQHYQATLPAGSRLEQQAKLPTLRT